MVVQKTTVDWLRFRSRAQPNQAVEALRPMFGSMGPHLKLRGLERGILGFTDAVQITVADMVLGRIDYGGESQRGWARVDLPGKACEWVKDWTALDLVESLPDAQIKRLDLALTTWDGEVTHERVCRAHSSGRFTTRGRPPILRQITSSDPRAGRTCYVGNRESDKFMRCYEKGFELAAKLGHSLADSVISIDGKKVEDIYRCELELKDKDTPIPWEVIERRDQYFTGAYPFCADILPGVEADILMRRPERDPQLSLKAALANIRHAYGATLFTALHAYHGDMTAVWDQCIGDKHNKDLLEAGVLLVDHD